MAELSTALPTPEWRASDAEREAVAERLRRAATDGRITLSELDERLGAVYGARTVGELDHPIRDLPDSAANVHPALRPTSAPLIGGAPGGWRVSVAFFGSHNRNGSWVVPRLYTAVSVFGRISLDLRDVTFAEAETHVRAFALSGTVKITVPEGVTVAVDGVSLLGRYDDVRDGPAASPGTPRLRITGVAVMGSVKVRVRPPSRERRQWRLRSK